MTPRPTLSAHFFVRRILLHCSVCVSLCTRRRNLIVIVFVFYKVTMMVFIIIILSVPLWLIFHFVRRIWNTQNTNTKNSIGFMNYSFPSRIFWLPFFASSDCGACSEPVRVYSADTGPMKTGNTHHS